MKQLKNRLEMYIKENQKLLKKHSLTVDPAISFPKRAKVPFWSRICIKIISRQGGETGFNYQSSK